jgi:hypothetical protein
VADQMGSGTLAGATGSGTPGLTPYGGEAHANGEVHHHGRPISWIAVSVIMVGFIIGGIAMVPHPTWWLFWTAAGIAIAGCVMTLVARTFDTDWY